MKTVAEAVTALIRCCAIRPSDTHTQLFVLLRQNLHPQHKQKAQKSAHVTAAQQSTAMQMTLCATIGGVLTNKQTLPLVERRQEEKKNLLLRVGDKLKLASAAEKLGEGGASNFSQFKPSPPSGLSLLSFILSLIHRSFCSAWERKKREGR